MNTPNIPHDSFVHETFATLHPMAEVGYEEVNTSGYLAEQLRSFGYTVTTNIGTTGVMGVLQGKEPGLQFALRADMDALPFEVDGKSCAIHACGHDANSSMVLATAREAALRGIEKGTLHIVFQQAEERVGAEAMAKTGLFDHIEEMVGIHLRPIAEAKLGEVISALCTGAGYFVTIHIKGIAAHGARHHLGVNALTIANQIINQMGAAAFDPSIPHSIKPTQIATTGNPKNTIPDQCTLTFDVRSMDDDLADKILTTMDALAKNCAALAGGEIASIDITGVPAAIIDSDMEAVCEQAVQDVMGDSLGRRTTNGGEDVHYFRKLAGIKLGYIGVGANVQHGLHHQHMSFDPKALDIGCAVLKRIVELKLGYGKEIG